MPPHIVSAIWFTQWRRKWTAASIVSVATPVCIIQEPPPLSVADALDVYLKDALTAKGLSLKGTTATLQKRLQDSGKVKIAPEDEVGFIVVVSFILSLNL